MIFFITTFILSGIGIAVMLSTQVLKIKKLPSKELKSAEYVSNAHFLKDILKNLFIPVYNFWDIKIIPRIYHVSEKIAHKMRIYVLKTEKSLLKLTNYIKGKREIKNNGNASKFLRNLNKKIKK
jgi:hypothetical protein